MYQESLTIHGTTTPKLKRELYKTIDNGFNALSLFEINSKVWFMQYVYKNGGAGIHVVEESAGTHRVVITSNGELLTGWKLDARRVLKRVLSAAPKYGWIVEEYNPELLNTPLTNFKPASNKMIDRM